MEFGAGAFELVLTQDSANTPKGETIKALAENSNSFRPDLSLVEITSSSVDVVLTTAQRVQLVWRDQN